MPRLYATRRTPHPTERQFDLVCKAKVNSTAGLDVRTYSHPVFKSFPMCRFPWTEALTVSDCKSYADQLGLRFVSIGNASDAYADVQTTGFACKPTGNDNLMPSGCARTLDSEAAIYAVDGGGGYGDYNNTYAGPDVNHRVVFSENEGVPNGGRTGWNGCEQTMRVCKLDYTAIHTFDNLEKIIKQGYEGYLEAALTKNLFCSNPSVRKGPRLYCKTEFEWRDDVSIPITLGAPYDATAVIHDVRSDVIPFMTSQGLVRFPTNSTTQLSSPSPPALPIPAVHSQFCRKGATCKPMYAFQQDACQLVWNMQTQGACLIPENKTASAQDCASLKCDSFIDCSHGGGALRCAVRQVVTNPGGSPNAQCEAVCELASPYDGDGSPRCGLDPEDGQIACPAPVSGSGKPFEDVQLSTGRPMPPATPSLPMAPPPPPFLPFPPHAPHTAHVAIYNVDARWQATTAHGSLARWPERLMGVMRGPTSASSHTHTPGFPYRYVYQQAKDGASDSNSLFDPVLQRGRIVTYEGNDAFDTRSEFGAWQPPVEEANDRSMSWMMIQTDPLNSPIDLRNVGIVNKVSSMVGNPVNYTDQFGMYCLNESHAPTGYLENFTQRFAFRNVIVDKLQACTQNSLSGNDGLMWSEIWGQGPCSVDHRFGTNGFCSFGKSSSMCTSGAVPTTKPLLQRNPVFNKQCYNILILARHAQGASHSLRVGLTSLTRPTAPSAPHQT